MGVQHDHKKPNVNEPPLDPVPGDEIKVPEPQPLPPAPADSVSSGQDIPTPPDAVTSSGDGTHGGSPVLTPVGTEPPVSAKTQEGLDQGADKSSQSLTGAPTVNAADVDAERPARLEQLGDSTQVGTNLAQVKSATESMAEAPEQNAHGGEEPSKTVVMVPGGFDELVNSISKQDPSSLTAESLKSRSPPQKQSRRSRRRVRPSWKLWDKNIWSTEYGDLDDLVRSFGDLDVEEDTVCEEWVELDVLQLLDPGFPEDKDGALDASPTRQEWLRQKREEDEKNIWLDRIMSLAGKEKVKEHCLAVKERVAVAKRWQEDIKALKLDLVLQGKVDGDKRVIAQLYAEFLFSIGAVPQRKFKRSTDHRWPFEDTDATVVFFESADSIDQSCEISDILSKANERTEPAVLILSYSHLRPDSRRALASTQEARHRFPKPIHLSDTLTEPEATQLVQMILKQHAGLPDGVLDGSLLRVLTRKLLKPGAEDESPEDTVRRQLDLILVRREERIEKQWIQWARSRQPVAMSGEGREAQKPKLDDGTITREDVLGPDPEDVQTRSEPWKKIQELTGLADVKQEIELLFKLARANFAREAQGKAPIPTTLNRCFLGAPGVGKTTVAALYGAILAELGLVSKGHIVIKNPTDLIGPHVGHSEDKTRDALREAQGGVLVIDDAHMLYTGHHGTNSSDVYRIAVIDTLVAEIAGSPGEDRCVILAGYTDRMEEMFLNSNPGLQRRFPLESSMKFSSYDDNELCRILETKMARDDVQASELGWKVAREVLSRMRTNPKFGNGGDVESLLARAKVRQRARLDKAGVNWFDMAEILEPEDFDPDFDRSTTADNSRDSLFHGFVGYEDIILEFRGYQKMADGMRTCDMDPRPYIPWAFVFKGPPGTGKTSTARKVGQLFYDMRLISSTEVVTCSATDLIGEYCGQTGPKVRYHFEQGLGKVLFIDEAYRFTAKKHGDSFITEAIGEIVDCMTQPRYMGNMVVILAGYEEEMEELLRSNPGLRSRFPKHIHFRHMTPENCFTHMKHELDKLRIDVEDADVLDVQDLIHKHFRRLSKTKGWANGRDVETLAKRVIGHVFVKVAERGPGEMVSGRLKVSANEVLSFLRVMLEERGGEAIREFGPGETNFPEASWNKERTESQGGSFWVCLIPGARTPYVMKQVGKNHGKPEEFETIGPAYVHGLMDQMVEDDRLELTAKAKQMAWADDKNAQRDIWLV